MRDGRLLFARYAFMPNHLGYCGGNDNRTLLDYCVANQADEGLSELARQFQMAYPYLQFIARANGIADPLDPRVVEAYWLGNELLERVEMADFYRYLSEKIGPRLPEKVKKYVVGKAPAGARPRHSFHVLEVSMRTGALGEDVTTLDRCRISWGRVAHVDGDMLTAHYQPLVLHNGKLTLGLPQERRVRYRVGGRGYLSGLQPGQMVSMHWDWACDLLTPQQAARLERETRRHLALANQTL